MSVVRGGAARAIVTVHSVPELGFTQEEDAFAANEKAIS